MYILVDDDNIIRCVASKECNLHKDKFDMKKHTTKQHCIAGDQFLDGVVTSMPENYPGYDPDEVLIQAEMEKILRDQAIKNLSDKGLLK